MWALSVIMLNNITHSQMPEVWLLIQKCTLSMTWPVHWSCFSAVYQTLFSLTNSTTPSSQPCVSYQVLLLYPRCISYLLLLIAGVGGRERRGCVLIIFFYFRDWPWVSALPAAVTNRAAAGREQGYAEENSRTLEKVSYIFCCTYCIG